MEARYIIEKFTRCPGCRSFSLKELNPDETSAIPGVSSGNVFVCNNCGAQFALRGNLLKEIGSLLDQNKQEISKKQPIRTATRTFSRTAIFLTFFLCLIIGGILLLLQPWSQDQGQINALQQKVKLKQKVNQTKTNSANRVKAVIKEEDETKGETQPIEPVKVTQLQDEPETDGVEIEPISYKIFDDSGMKVRSSSPHRSDPALRHRS